MRGCLSDINLIATRAYPGGSSIDKNSIGFGWSKNFLSNLFTTKAINGTENPGWIWALVGMAFHSVGYGIFFINMSKKIYSKQWANIFKLIFSKMFAQLFSWAVPRNLINFPETQALTVYRSNANLLGMLQADVCITVPETTVGEGLIDTTNISGGLYAIFHKEAPMSECFKTWNFIYEVWFEENGYQPDNRNFFLSHRNDPKTHPQHFHIVDIYIPIKPL